MAKTRQADVVRIFHELYGRNPSSDAGSTDWDVVKYLTGKEEEDVRSKLYANSPKNPKSPANITQNKTQSTGEKSPGDIDPVKIAQGLGFSPQDLFGPQTKSLDEAINYWKGKSKAELEEALKKRGDFDSSLGRKRTQEEQTGSDAYSDWVNSQDLTDQQKDFLNNLDVDTNKVYTEDEFKKLAGEYETLARADVEPYYADQEKRGMEDIRDSYSDIRNQAERYQQQEAKSYKEQLASTKQNLRASGLTFSGRSRGVLGKEGALAGKGVEGELPQSRRYNYEDASAAWQQASRNVGKGAERKYGSETLYEQRDYLNPEGLPDPYGSGIDYRAGRTRALYSPKKKGQDGYISEDQADIEKAKEYDVQQRKQARLNQLRYYA